MDNVDIEAKTAATKAIEFHCQRGMINISKGAEELAVTAAKIALQHSIPEGYVLAPKEPTEAMIEAGYAAFRRFDGEYLGALIYQAQLSAIEGE